LVILFANNTDNPWNAETPLLVILLPAVIIGVASLCIYLLHRNGKLFSRRQERQVIEVSKYIATVEIAQMQ
jgi:uncharacterized integral membrane protein